MTGISVGSCDAMLTGDLHIKRVCAKFVPHLLTDDQREQRQKIARDLFELSVEDVQFLKNTVSGDESWVYGYDPETKQHSSIVSMTTEGAPGAKQNKGHVTGVFLF